MSVTIRSAWRLGGTVLLCAAGCTGGGAVSSEEAIEYRPSDTVVRLTAIPLDHDDIGLVRDFDIAGDTIYLLDATGRVVIVHRGDSRLQVMDRIGRRGGGPGEFLRPSGLTLAGPSLAIMDGTRIQLFTRSGQFMRSVPITLPCAMMLPSIAPARAGFFLHGTCLRRGVVTDTMQAVLAWSADTATWDVVIQTPRFTGDGAMGHVFGARSLLTTGPAGRHVFGGGEANCVWMVTDERDPPRTRETCPAARQLYRADPPPGLEERLRAGRFAGMNVKWPETLPVYTERFVTDGGIVLVRPFSADSVVLQSASPAAVDLAVAPLSGLLGCKPGGCVWLIEDTAVPALIVLDRSTIEHMLAEA